MKNYGKILLYSYGKLNKLYEEVKDLAYKKAMAGFYSDYDCERLASDIIRLNDAGDILSDTKEKMDKALQKFTKEELEYFEYRYFKRKFNQARPNPCDRQYFRIQRKLYIRFMQYLEKVGLTEQWFDENCMKLRYFSDMCDLYEQSRL